METIKEHFLGTLLHSVVSVSSMGTVYTLAAWPSSGLLLKEGQSSFQVPLVHEGRNKVGC